MATATVTARPELTDEQLSVARRLFQLGHSWESAALAVGVAPRSIRPLFARWHEERQR